jgi:hypothetical protein
LNSQDDKELNTRQRDEFNRLIDLLESDLHRTAAEKHKSEAELIDISIDLLNRVEAIVNAAPQLPDSRKDWSDYLPPFIGDRIYDRRVAHFLNTENFDEALRYLVKKIAKDEGGLEGLRLRLLELKNQTAAELLRHWRMEQPSEIDRENWKALEASLGESVNPA